MAFTDDIEENFMVGILDLMVLKLIEKEKKYGYQIKQDIYELSDNKIDIKAGSLYGPLYRLEKKKMIYSEKEFVGKKRFRVYYRITDLGKEYLECGLTSFDKIYTGAKKVLGDNYD